MNCLTKKCIIIIVKRLLELQETRDTQLNRLRKTIHEQSETFNKEIQTITIKQTEILGLKNTMAQAKNLIVSTTDSTKLKKESVNSKTHHLKLSRGPKRQKNEKE